MLTSSVFGPSGAQTFAGPAVVERSTSGDLVIAFDLPPAEAAAAAITSHLKVTGLRPLPHLAVGTRVWLERDVGTPASDFGPPPAESFRVLDKEGGTLLLGHSFTNSARPTTAAAPLQVVGVHTNCVEHNESCDGPHAERTWESVEVQGDSNFTLEPGVSTNIELGGIEYDAVAIAVSETADGTCAADYGALETIFVSVVASDFEALVVKLPLVEPPACSVHNDPEASAGFSLLGVSLGTDYAGPVVYQSTAQRDGLSYFEFSTPELSPQWADSPPSLELTDWFADFVPPKIGTSLYFESYGYSGGALFSEKGGSPLLVSAISLGPFDANMLNRLGSWLGVSVEQQESCDYTTLQVNGQSQLVPLYQLVLGTQPPVTVHTAERIQLVLDGKKYEAYLGGLEASSFLLRAL